MDRHIVDRHPQKINVEQVKPDEALTADQGWVDMVVKWVATKDTVGSERSVFGITTMPPGSRHDVHRHPHAEEVVYLTSGEGVYQIGDTPVRMRAGDVVLAKVGQWHAFWNTSDTETAVLIWLYGGASSLEEAGYECQATH
jgi:quercetin dioxygenase-like cupin family protein